MMNTTESCCVESNLMCKSEIEVGGEYFAKIGHVIRPVRVDEIRLDFRGGAAYHVTNLRSGRSTVLDSHRHFRGPCVDYLEHRFGHSQIIAKLRKSLGKGVP